MMTIKSKIEKARNHLAQHLMKEPSIKQLSDFLEIDEKDIEKILNYSDTFSIDDTYYEDLSLHEVISDREIDINTLLYLKTMIEKLDEPEKTIMIKRYYEDKTQTQVAKLTGLSQVDVSRREKKVLKKIRSYV